MSTFARAFFRRLQVQETPTSFLQLPTPGKMTPDQVNRYRSLIAFQLRASGMDHLGIGAVLNVSTGIARRLVKIGRRTLVDCVVMTVPD